ncbi:MAG: FtsX-like permease family protein [Deltaproteobacteria bacterium]|nr:FtsX-like permease family protein [Deltaproteobacteria bacterium]
MIRIRDYSLSLFKLTVNNIRRHPVINLISISIITLAMLLLALYLLAYGNVTRIVSLWRADLRLAVYLEDDLDQARLSALQAYCLDLRETKKVVYISPEQALANFKVTLGDDAVFLEGLTENPLPSSFEILLDEGVAELGDVERLARQLKRQAGVVQVEYGHRWLMHLFSFLRMIKYFGYLMAIFLSAVTVFIVASTIRLSLYARRDTIRVLRLVGATSGFIALPYFFEGIFQGVAASALALSLAYAGFRYFCDWLRSQAPQWAALSQLHFFSVSELLFFILVGTFLGVAGFLLSSRWLRVEA